MITRRRIGILAIGLLAGFLLIQAIPYGHAHDNPAPGRELRFDSATTARLFRGACGDCHSDRTTWPWYSKLAPVSWLVQRDVDEGRGILDVSQWDRAQPSFEEVIEEVREGGMPPLQYKLIHGDARLSDGEKQALAEGLRRSWTADPPGSIRR
jgi:mono/diheme cytochrome c family protein